MRVSINKLTGKLIECQSGGRTHPDPKINDGEYALTNLDVLRQNAIRAGHLEKDIEVKFVTDAEYETLLEALIPEPTEEEIAEAISDQAKADLVDIDIKSIRSIREWLVMQPDIPQYLVDYEAEAIEKRTKIK